MKRSYRKILPIIIRLLITLSAWISGVYILCKYEYFISFGDIDNIIGAIPVALVITGASGITIIFILRTKYIKLKKYTPVSAVIASLVVLSAVLFPVALHGNWWINPSVSSETQAAPDLSVYTPFEENSQLARLNEESELKIKDNFPVLDGATALLPVYAAFAEAVYAEEFFSPDYVLCSNTRGAYESVISGKSDIIFAAGASERQLDAAKSAGADLKFTPIGREAFVFLAGRENPVDDISYRQIKNIYSGKTAYWSTLGWKEGGKIIAFQRPEGSGSQTGLHNIMGNIPVQVPQPLPDSSLTGTNSLMRQVSVEWRGVQPALGYSYKYYATVMYANPDVKLLKIDGIEPSAENIRNGSYIFTNDFYAVTNGEPKGNIKLLIDWILSPQGQKIIEETGYTPLMS